MGNSASSLPYAIGKQTSTVNHGWCLHEGTRKSDSEPVSVFVAKKPSLWKTPVNPKQTNLTQYETAHHHYSNAKRLRHPHILKVHATLDTDNPNDSTGGNGSGKNSSNNKTAALGSSNNAVNKAGTTGDFIIVTEPCIPLSVWLTTTRPSPEQLAWGLECILRGLQFLHSQKLVHGCVTPDSFYVTKAGDVKLWNFCITVDFNSGSIPRHFIDWEGLVTAPPSYRAPERCEGRWDAIAALAISSGTHGMDSFSLGALIAHIFGGVVPPKLVKAVQRLQTQNLKMRPKLQPLLNCPIFATPYQKLQLSVEELPIQDPESKIAFWNNVTPNLTAQVIPEIVAVYKLLPILKSTIMTISTNESMRVQDVYRRELLSTLKPLFYIAENFLDAETVGKQLGAEIGILFKVNDRAIRGTLLQKAPFMAGSFDKTTLNEAIFEPMCSGFSDSSAALRELTLKATAALVPHLSHPNLEKLSRYLVRLQGDPENSIRTNTVIFFSKLASYLTETTRQKVLLPAFVRAMKDPFTPCRLSALKSTVKAKEFFDPTGVATRVLPAVTPQLLDASKEVRREAFQAVDELLFVLRQESERLNSLPTSNAVPQQQVVTAAPVSANSTVTSTSQPAAVQEAPKSGGFGFSGISSWMTSKTVPETASASAPPRQQLQQQGRAVPAAPQPVAPVPAMNNLDLQDSWGEDGDGDGWGDDDLETSNSNGGGLQTTVQSVQAAPVIAAKNNNFFAGGGDGDDFFGGFDAKPAKPVIRSMGGKLTMPKKKPPGVAAASKPAILKLDSEDMSEGWGDDF